MSQLPANILFSPSLARAHLAQTKDWNYIDAWLARHFSKPPPPFERNADTLKALLTLAAHNESADEERGLLARVEEKTLQSLYEKSKNDPDGEILATLENSLTKDGQAALETLAELSHTLDLAVPDVERLGKRIVELNTQLFQLEQASDRISVLESHLKQETTTIAGIVTTLQSETYQTPPDMAQQTSEYQRKSKALTSSMPKLQDKVTSLDAGLDRDLVTIEDIKAQEDRYRERMSIVKELEAQVKSFHGLPQDTDLARLELESHRLELRDLTLERDRMFEGLVERESPQKRR